VVTSAAGSEPHSKRCDNGLVRWYDRDLPDVMTARQLIPEVPRRTFIASSFLPRLAGSN